jgi:SP family galactose:H+ symporter-like MFS transporter
LIFAVICLLGLAFLARYVAETRNRNYEQSDADLKSRWQPPAEAA